MPWLIGTLVAIVILLLLLFATRYKKCPSDKILVITAMIWFSSVGLLPVWALVIVVAREFAVSGLRLIAVDNGRVIAAAWSGKVKTFSTMVCLCLMHLPIPELLVQVCVWVIVITTVYSGIEYFWKNKDVMK